MLEILPVQTKKQVKSFIDFPHDLYKNDPNYVPELYLSQKELLSEKKNPFFKHSKAKLFLASEKGKTIGRIAAIRNNNYIEYAGENAGFFGFFEVVEDYGVAKALLDKAIEWLEKENMKAVYGPTNFTTNDVAGMLIDGFDSPPTVMMAYNKPYYPQLLEQYGFKKQLDLYAYLITREKVAWKSVELAQRLEQRLAGKGITIRSVNKKKFKEEVGKVKTVYRQAWEKNWGFVPPTDEEFEHLAAGLKFLVDPDFIFLAEYEGKTVGFIMAVPDINWALRKVSRGRLFPFGIVKLLVNKNKIKKIRILLLGVLENYRKLGIEAIFYSKIIQNGIARNFTEAEASWILENNEMMNQGLKRINAEVYKTYRMYKKLL